MRIGSRLIGAPVHVKQCPLEVKITDFAALLESTTKRSAPERSRAAEADDASAPHGEPQTQQRFIGVSTFDSPAAPQYYDG
jgi:hypothetical protein